jgi:hypothetical protein
MENKYVKKSFPNICKTLAHTFADWMGRKTEDLLMQFIHQILFKGL